MKSIGRPYRIDLDSKTDSRSRGSSNNPTFNIPPQVVGTDEIAIITLESATIPASWDAVSANNNTLALYYSGGAAVPITLPVGNPTATELADKLETELKTYNASFTVTYDRATNKFTINATIAFAILLATDNSAYELLGLPKSDDAYSAEVNDSGTYDLKSSVPVDLQGGMSTLFIHSDIASASSYSTRRKGTSSILSVIPVDVGRFDMVQYMGNDAFETVVHGSTSISSITLAIRNSDDELVDLNGLDWRASILIKIYKK